jgi:hypothetical protein
MTEKDYKKVEEKAGTQTNTVQLTPEMTLFLSALTNTYQTIQKTMVGAPQPGTEQAQPKEITGKAKEAVEKFNDILAGLQLKPPLAPPVVTSLTASSPTEVRLNWSISPETGNPSGFKIMRAQDPEIDKFMQVGDLLLPSATEYLDRTVISKTRYRYQVVALTFRGEGASTK